ncbi:DMT family transporter [Halarsenatibacter silvermanii]|uniref:Permease of the drug/metabolite transporter (DMT) superfamily n=1 Tax=Halarsenatibacter silvermanii TaxID=321763 RepID=A0A1G9LLE6_9FIRM|nr:DMT family transporter [Halarsenatibacter silvermanii]SDL62577.1 Permease of the drug/metabolite transporter (DMT) superfamily [Halarsenatibacter silvermanii]
MAGLTFSLVFGFSFLFSKEALDIIAPFHLLGFRFLMASLVITILRFMKVIKTNFTGKSIKPLMIISIFQPFLYFTFEIMGINFTTSSQAGLMISLIPVATAVLGAIFLEEVPGWKQSLCIILSVLGVGLVVTAQGDIGSQAHYLGIIFLLGAVISGGAYNIISRSISIDYTPVEITFFMCYSGAVLFNLLGIISFEGAISTYGSYLFNAQVMISVIYLSTLSSILAFFMLNYALSRLPASQASVFANLTTVVSILAGVLIRGEPFYAIQAWGALLIIIGVWGTNYFELRSEENPQISKNLQKE